MAAFEAIASTSLGSDTSTVTFSSIPGTYRHLQLKIYGRTSHTSSIDRLRYTFNSNTPNDSQTIYSMGSGIYTNTNTGSNWIYSGDFPGNTAASNTFGVAIIDILDYAQTTKYKTSKFSVGFMDSSGNTRVTFGQGTSRLSNALTSIEISTEFAANWKAGSVFSLYGLKET